MLKSKIYSIDLIISKINISKNVAKLSSQNCLLGNLLISSFENSAEDCNIQRTILTYSNMTRYIYRRYNSMYVICIKFMKLYPYCISM